MTGIENFFTQTVSNAIAQASVYTFLVVFIGGIVTSLSPCILSMLPVMVGYIGGYSQSSKARGFAMSSMFVLGLGVTFAVLGVTAASLGKVFGQVGNWWYYIIGFAAIIMGLQLLEVIHLKFPGISKMPVKVGGLPGAFLTGLFFGLVASPCATPVLAVLITYVASKGALGYGAALLFVYGLGHGTPLLVVGTFTALIKSLSVMQRWSKYMTYFSGVIMIGLGLYFLAMVAGL